MAWRAVWPISFNIEPPLPMTMPFCESFSTNSVALMKAPSSPRSVNWSMRTASA